MSAGNKKTILLVGDEPATAMKERSELEKYDYRVVTAFTGEEAAGMIRNNSDIGLVLADLDSGEGMDGSEAAILILKEFDIPVIFLSGHTGPEIIRKTENIFSYGFLEKNSGIAVLDASIKTALKLFEANKNARKELENFLKIFSAAPVGLLLLDDDTVITDTNRPINEMILRNPADIIGNRAGSGLGCANSMEDPRGCGFGKNCHSCILRKGLEGVLAGGPGIHGAEIELSLLIGGSFQPRWLSIGAEPIELDGSHYIIVAIDDITGRKRSEEEIKTLLNEKEIMLKEVHHRIKNNLNTINSLLQLKAKSIEEPTVSNVLNDISSRIMNLAILYDKLYQSHNFKNVAAVEYLPAIIGQVVGNFPNSASVKFETRIDGYELDIKKAQSIGIIINELISNIMKYAFSGREEGLIIVSSMKKDNHVSLTVEDNGNGLPESVNFENSKGFGLRLVGMLIKQLGGSIHIERGNGTRILLEFQN